MILSISQKRCHQGKKWTSSGRWLKTKMVIKIELTPLPDWKIVPFFNGLKKQWLYHACLDTFINSLNHLKMFITEAHIAPFITNRSEDKVVNLEQIQFWNNNYTLFSSPGLFESYLLSCPWVLEALPGDVAADDVGAFCHNQIGCGGHAASKRKTPSFS